MKRNLIVLALSLPLTAGFLTVTGCSQEVHHTETDKPRLLGGRTHEETTTYKNPDGTYSTEKSTIKTP